MNNDKGSNSVILLVVYEIIYVLVILKILPMLKLAEVANAAVTAAMTLASAVLIGKTFIEERNAGRGRKSLTLLSLCALITVFVLYQTGIYG
ncbi:MAG: hypothetical protein PUE18_01295 [Firmicutes bacterium]|nr:hypothetical protein [Bacillota bacterium]